MKEIFDWLREQFCEDEEWYQTHGTGGLMNKGIIAEARRGVRLINEAEAKWEADVKQLEKEVIALEDNYGDLVECIPKDVVFSVLGKAVE